MIRMLDVRKGLEHVLVAGNSATIVQRARARPIQTSEAGAFGRTQHLFENQLNLPAVADVVFVQDFGASATECLPSCQAFAQLSPATREPVQMAVGPAEGGLQHVMEATQALATPESADG